MSRESQRTCPSCGNEFSGAMEFCPVCMLHKALAGTVKSGESSFEEAARPTPVHAVQRFEHYQLVTGEDGKPVELGRGAMGVTYKAFDVDLHCPVTLKVISEKYLGDESARLRFLREARAAARLRHSNVASVLHLGRTGSSYFYAMEFVEGETLENLIKRSGRLDVKLALEINNAGGRRSGGSSRTEPCPPGHQTKQHHGELGGRRRCHRKNHRPRAGQGGQSTRFSNRNFNGWGLCRDTIVRQSRAICRRWRGYPFRSLLAWGGVLGDADRPCGVQGFPS